MIGKLRKKNKVLMPNEMFEAKYIGKIFGKFHESSGVFNIFTTDMIQSGLECEELGEIVSMSNTDIERCVEKSLVGSWNGEYLSFEYLGEKYEIEQYSLVQNIFSRNTGILESSIMRDKTAIILGCGSVGSLVALQLAKSGVGNFLLVDNDIVEYHNLCRHQCGISDVGRYKTDALKEKILNINASAKVICEVSTVELLRKEAFDEYCIKEKTIIVGCADNRTADVYANSIAVMYKVPFISIGFWERAFAGEIFYYLPEKNMPCYKCALGDGVELSNRTNANRRIYTNEEDLTKVVFEPGIAADIDFVTTVGIKLILDILNRDSEGYTIRLLDSLQQYTLVCNTNKSEIGGEMAEIFSYPLQVTTSLKVAHCVGCPPCEFE